MFLTGVYTHVHTLKTLQNFSIESVQQCNPRFFGSLQWCQVAKRIAFSSAQVLLVLVENGNGLLTHSCCVGEAERLKQKLKDLKSRLAQHWQVSRCFTCMRKCYSLAPFHRNRSELDARVPILPTVCKCTRIPIFFLEWASMRKQSIPDHFPSSHMAWERGH